MVQFFVNGIHCKRINRVSCNRKKIHQLCQKKDLYTRLGMFFEAAILDKIRKVLFNKGILMVKVKTIHKLRRYIQLMLVMSGLMSVVPVHAFFPQTKHELSAHKMQLKPQHPREVIVLIHGLMRTSLSMWPLKNFLKRNGYEVYTYSYPSHKYSIQEHGTYLNQYIKNLLAKNPGVKINFITHSLGGIITREALSKLSKEQLKDIGSLIMLAPPNQGSKLAKISTKVFPMLTFPIKPLAELSSDQTSYVHHVPVPNIKIGIIAGRYDAKVPPEYARLEGQNDPVIVNANHTFIMNNAKTRELIMNFLETGTFGPVAGKISSYKEIKSAAEQNYQKKQNKMRANI